MAALALYWLIYARRCRSAPTDNGGRTDGIHLQTRAPDALRDATHLRELRDRRGLPTFEITRMMGTSVAMLDKTLATCSAMPPCAAEGSWTPSTRAKMRRLGLSGATE